MLKVVSKDGTSIAFEKRGAGPAVILVDGALCYRASGPMNALADSLKQHFTLFTYDRRGRGDSGDTAPYSVEREIEDIRALVKEAGGSAFVFGESSGGALALEAASRCRDIKKIALYEAPFIVDDSQLPLPENYIDELNRLLVAGKRGGLVKMFLKLVGVPGFLIALMQLMPV